MHRILAPAFQAQSLHEVIGLSRQAVRKMERFGIFEDVKMQLDSPSDPWLQDRKDMVDLGIWVKESSRVQIKTGTEAGNAEASMVMSQGSSMQREDVLDISCRVELVANRRQLHKFYPNNYSTVL